MQNVDMFTEFPPSPFEKASVFSKATYSWIDALIKLGSQRPLEESDIPRLPLIFSCEFVKRISEPFWEREKAKKNPFIAYPLVLAFFLPYVISGLLFFPYVVVVLLQPYFVTSILDYVTKGSSSFLGIDTGIGQAIVLGVLSMVGVLAVSASFYFTSVSAIPIRNSLIALIFEKSLKLSSTSRTLYSTGDIVTLISVDCERIWLGLLYTHWLWAGPVMAVVAMVLLIIETGYAGMAALFSMILINYLQKVSGEWVGITRKRQIKYTAERTKVMNEILQGIRVIKLYAWEVPTTKRIEELRRQEVQWLTNYHILKAVNTALTFLGPLLVAFTLFITYIYLGTAPTLTVPKVYTTYALLNVIRLPFSLTPQAWASWNEAYMSCNRISAFMLLDEIDTSHFMLMDGVEEFSNGDSSDSSNSISDSNRHRDSNSNNSNVEKKTFPLISIQNATFFWGKENADSSGDSSKKHMKPAARNSKNDKQLVSTTEDVKDVSAALPALTNISLTINNTDFIAIVGSVGSGKTSLVSALTNELHMTEGKFYQRSASLRTAYVAQEHWIQNINLKQNILFDMPYEDELYCEVMDASQLTKDLLVLPHADMTYIGERGLNLSGGQKARVNIARALYARNHSDIYIFDDSLASVDVHVGKALFSEAICGMVADKCRIVVLSSNYHFLSQFNKIVVMDKGSIAMTGTYDEVVKKFPQYSGVQPGGDDTAEDTTTPSTLEATDGDHISHGDPAYNDDNDGAEPGALTKQVSLFRQHSSTIAARQDLASTLMSEEDREKGAVSMSTYVNYFSVSSMQTQINATQSAVAVNASANSETRKRAQSMSSVASVQLQFKEDGGVQFSRSQYLRGLATLVFILLLFGTSQTTRVFSDLWIGLYAKDINRSDPRNDSGYYMTWYYVLIWGTVLLVILRSYLFIMSCLGASRKLHEILLTSVLNAPVNTYFDVTPIGRILNRFSKDLDSMDSLLPDFLLQSMQNVSQVMAIVIVCIASSTFFILLFIPIAIVFFYIQTYFRKTCRELKRLESIARSPMYSLFGEILQGHNTIRAYGRIDIFTKKFFYLSDNQMRNFFAFWMSNRWLALRLDIVANLIVFAVAILGVSITDSGGGIDPNLLGIGLVYSLQLTALLQWTVRQAIDAETNATSVERLLAFVNIVPEKSVAVTATTAEEDKVVDVTITDGDVEMQAVESTAPENNSNNSHSNSHSNSTNTSNAQHKYALARVDETDQIVSDENKVWPAAGEIRFENLKLRYRPELSLVLHGIDYTIPGGTKVGVVGRTAAGKSSLMLSLFRIIEPETHSTIRIDGVDIQSVPLQQLRSSITIIPQDPFMFSGTLRYNLDPFNIYTDEAIWEALDRTHLKQDVIEKFPLKLQHEISERGENISVGQRQMVCIARALLRNSKVIIMDEATASVDSATDRKIQVTIREEFKRCTVLTIAHRLETIADFDLVLVMENGLIVEAGSPLQLLHLDDDSSPSDALGPADPHTMGIFEGFVHELGPERKAQFVHAARNRQIMNTAEDDSELQTTEK